jgi:hypothetical protein
MIALIVVTVAVSILTALGTVLIINYFNKNK